MFYRRKPAYYTYIMCNYTRTVFYVGFTGCIDARVYDHKNDNGCVFTRKYKCYYLVYYEEFNQPILAINRESQLKNWKRQWKIELIRNENPDLKDLSADWY